MVSVVIQAGGNSRRMGEDKGLILFQGEPLIKFVVGRIASLGDELIVTSNSPKKYAFLGVPVVEDILTEKGALAGLYTALSCARGEKVIVIGCDMPFVNRSLLEYEIQQMSENIDAVVPLIPEGLEPFHAVYRRENCRLAVRSTIEAGMKKAIDWFPKIRLYKVSQDEITRFDPLGLAFFNINDRTDLAEAERFASSLAGEES